MANIMDFFMPQAQGQPQPDMQGAMADPKLLSALLGFGVNAMIPQWGGGMVQMAKGIGGAGETLDRQEESARKQQETDSKSELRASQATAAEARANTAGTRASLTGIIEEGKRQRADLATRVRLSNLYQNYVRNLATENAAIRKQNSDPLKPVGSPPIPEKSALPMNEWIAANPMLTNLGLVPPKGAAPADSGDGEDAGIPPAAGPDVASTVQAPANPQQRQAGTTYMTPKGPLKWTGTGWVNP